MKKLETIKKKKHMSEYEAVKARLEKSINAKLKQRMTEYEQLLLRIQNCHNDMMNKQSVQFGKIQSVHAKLLTKHSLNIDDIANRYHQIHEEDPDMIHEDEEYEEKQLSHKGNKDTFSKHLDSSSQGDMKIVEENFEEESSLTNARHFNKNGSQEIRADSEGMKTQGQINGYWKRDHIEDFNKEGYSNEHPQHEKTPKLEETLEQTNGFNNFHQIDSNQENSNIRGRSRSNSSDKKSQNSSSSSSKSGSSRSSSSSSSSSSDSD